MKFPIRKVLLVIILVASTIHLVKDITQDIMQIPTLLDNFGDIREDLSGFSSIAQQIFFGVAVLSVIGEIFLVVTIPLALKRSPSKLDRSILFVTLAILAFFFYCFLLDPRFIIFSR